MTTTSEIKQHHGCKGSVRGKFIQLSNAFRHALGLPLIEAGEHPAIDAAIAGKPHPHPEVHILPLPLPPFEGNPESFAHGSSQLEDIPDHPAGGPVEHPHHHHHKHKTFRKHGCGKRVKGFMMRVHKAITALGPWEGRAVAFVLGMYLLALAGPSMATSLNSQQDVASVFCCACSGYCLSWLTVPFAVSVKTHRSMNISSWTKTWRLYLSLPLNTLTRSKQLSKTRSTKSTPKWPISNPR